jgi:hypothetical protein
MVKASVGVRCMVQEEGSMALFGTAGSYGGRRGGA